MPLASAVEKVSVSPGFQSFTSRETNSSGLNQPGPNLGSRDEALQDPTLLRRLQVPPAPGQIRRLLDDRSPLVHILDKGLDRVEDRCFVP